MPKNIGLGGKNKKKGKKIDTTERELALKEDENEEYAQVIRPAGDSRFEVLCSDGTKRFGHVAGKLRKRVFINLNDIVLVQVSEYEPEKCHIVLKYTEDEVRKLRKAKEIPENFNKTSEETNTENKGDNNLIDDDDDFIKFDKVKETHTKKKNKNKKEEESDDNEDEEDEDDEEDNDDNEEEEKDNESESLDANEDEEEENEEEEEVDTGYKYPSNKLNKTKRQMGNDKKRIIDDL